MPPPENFEKNEAKWCNLVLFESEIARFQQQVSVLIFESGRGGGRDIWAPSQTGTCPLIPLPGSYAAASECKQ